ncbi:uncharacterized protein LOC129582232 [Paramacrobiotus metropolitanus]|uniref:uncharacterized protein LOC129582232 n=1 Tax=Paramacrobiotus metropolitanus TaxID=2943436 RepID=UPI00244612C4|nr:uncharacterized protein LOC129582232 [Paramacrobiotus metropolitanus]
MKSLIFLAACGALLAGVSAFSLQGGAEARLPDWMLANQTAYVYTTTMEGLMLAATNLVVNDMCNSYEWGAWGQPLAAHVAGNMKAFFPNYHWHVFMLDNKQGGGKFGYDIDPAVGAQYSAECKYNRIYVWGNLVVPF